MAGRCRYALELQALAASLATPADNERPALLTLDQAASEQLLSFERDLEPRLAAGSGDLAQLAGWAAKLAGATCRLAGLLHMAGHLRDGWAHPIGSDTFAGAARLAGYLVEHARAVFDLMGADPRVDDARWLLDWISRTNQAQFTRRDAHSTAPRGRFPKATNLDPAWPSWRSTGSCAALTLTPPGPRAAGRPPHGSSSTPCTTPQNPQNPQNRSAGGVLWVVWVLWRVATPREAADEGKGGCHVIQRERPQLLPAISGVGPRGQPPPAARVCASTARFAERRPPLRCGEALMGSVSWRKRGNRYLVSWRLDDGSQGGKTVDTPDQARDLAAEKRLEMRRGTWRERRSGRLSFSQWADDWWEVWAADPDRSPTTLAATENRLRRHVRPWFNDQPIERISPADIRRWQAQLASMVGRESLLACRSILHRILQFAEDEGAIPSNPVRKVPPPKRRADPEQLLGEAKRRAYTPEEAGRLLGRMPLSWWDHVLVFLGTGLRFGELAGLRCRRVRLDRSVPVLQVVEVRYQAGSQFGSGFKGRPKSDAGIRELPLAPLLVESIRRQLPPDADPEVLVFTGPGGGNGVPAGSRTMLSRYNFRRVYQRAVDRARHDLAAVDPHGPHDLRHTFSTWLEDAGIPARVIDELMGHERSRRGELEGGSRIGARYRHTTPEMAVRVAAAIQERLGVVVQIAEAVLELDDSSGRVF